MKKINLLNLFVKHGLGPRVGIRSEGERVAVDVMEELKKIPEKELLIADFKGVEVFSHSFADEVIARPLLRLVNQEYGDKYFAVLMANDELRVDLDEALKRRDIAIIRFRDEELKTWEVLGVTNNQDTLKIISDHGPISTGEVAEKMGNQSIQACSNRVVELGRLRLIRRERIVGERGVKFENEFIR